MKKLSSRSIAITAALASLSAAFQLIHVGYQSPQWGMWIDFVAVFWISGYFLFGLDSALLISLTGALIITLFAPDTWLGASMKWIATFPIWVSLHIYLKILGKRIEFYKKWQNLIVPALLGIFLRSFIIIPINYYYAIPIWTGMTPLKAISTIPWYVIAGFNSVQAVIDIFFAWIIVYKFKLTRYSPRLTKENDKNSS